MISVATNSQNELHKYISHYLAKCHLSLNLAGKLVQVVKGCMAGLTHNAALRHRATLKNKPSNQLIVYTGGIDPSTILCLVKVVSNHTGSCSPTKSLAAFKVYYLMHTTCRMSTAFLDSLV